MVKPILRTKSVGTKITDDEYQRIEAARGGQSMSEWVREALLQVVERFLGKDISLEYLGFIPYDDAIPRAVMRQQPVLALFPQAPASKAFTAIARFLWESPPRRRVDGNIKFFWSRLVHQAS